MKNSIRIKVYKKLPKEICEKYDGAQNFLNDKIEEICSYEKLSAVYVFLALK